MVSTTDLLKFLACEELTTFDLLRSAGILSPLARESDNTIAQRLGLETEYDALGIFEERYGEAVRISGNDEIAFELTLTAMKSGAKLIYQGVLFYFEKEFVYESRPDFLVRADYDSKFGNYAYEPVDSKLGKSPGLDGLLQILDYGDVLSKIQGALPKKVHLFLAGAEQVSYRSEVYIEEVRLQKERYLRTLEKLNRSGLVSGDEVFIRSDPKPNSYCPLCDWFENCSWYWETSDSLYRVAGITRSQVERLREAGISSLRQLAGSDAADIKAPISLAVLKGLIAQASAQVKTIDASSSKESGAEGSKVIERPYFELREDVYELAKSGSGLGLLPAPDEGDIYFDIEGDPFYKPDGLEYLFGVAFHEDGELRFKAFWGVDQSGERKAFGELIDFIMDRWKSYPKLHIYHYADYERNALAKLASRCNYKIFEVDTILRSNLLVDLYPVVKGSIVLGADSYSLKKIEKIYLHELRHEAVTTAMGSVESFEAWLGSGDPELLEEIERYNEIDVRSTAQLRDFLCVLRDQVIEKYGPLEYRISKDGSQDQVTMSDAEIEYEYLESGLRSLAEKSKDPKTAGVYQLTSDLVRYHLREDKPIWWRYFNLISPEREVSDYNADSESIGGVEKVGSSVTPDGKIIEAYVFDPKQSIKLDSKFTLLDPDYEYQCYLDPEVTKSKTPVGKIIRLDLVAGEIEIEKNANFPNSLVPRNFVGWNFVSSKVIQDSLKLFAKKLIDSDGAGVTADVGMEILGRSQPRFNYLGKRILGLGEFKDETGLSETSDLDRFAIDASLALDSSYLIIQGPPGAGKTYLGAKIIAELLNHGKKIFVTATSHPAIDNLFEALLAMVEPNGMLYRVGPSSRGKLNGVKYIKSSDVANVSLADGGCVLGGTAWVGSKGDLAGHFDYGFIDEAGQFSLANSIAISSCCKNMIMSGDPQQLAQPIKGSHPWGASFSVLEHLIGDNYVVDQDYGIFLPKTYRMHHSITEVVSTISYESRLSSVDELARLELISPEPLPKNGLAFVPVSHLGNEQRSYEEVEVVKRLVKFLRARNWVDRWGNISQVGADQIMVVTPYNAQSYALANALGDSASVGTVDKFQGKEAAFVILSLAASDAESSSRGVDFLFSTNRLNVAISRAKVMSIVVASPSLIESKPRTIAQLELLGAVAKVIKASQVVSLDQLS